MNSKKLTDNITDVIEKLYANNYFTNHGPLAREFEKTIAQATGFRNAVAINSFEIALLIGVNAHSDTGSLISIGDDKRLPNILKLSGNNASCFENHKNFESASQVCSDGLSKLIYTSGNDCGTAPEVGDENSNVALIEHCNYRNFQYRKNFEHYVAIVNLKEAFDVDYDFEGAVLFCDDDVLAEKFRNMRSSYGINRVVGVKATCNGRFSEFQAGLYLKYVQANL